MEVRGGWSLLRPTDRDLERPTATGCDVHPHPGDVIEVTRQASVQFTTPIRFRVIRARDWPTYSGWVWLDGYQLNSAGEAIERRSIFVRAGGLRPASPTGRRSGRAGAPPAPAPRQRTTS